MAGIGYLRARLAVGRIFRLQPFGLAGTEKEKGPDRPLQILERVKGIEPSLSAWEAEVLPLNYTREGLALSSLEVTNGKPIRVTHMLGQALIPKK